MQLWQLLTIQQLRSRRLVHCQMWQKNRKNCTSGIWIAGSRFCLGEDVLLWDLCSWHSLSQQSGSFSQVPLLARPVMLLEELSPGSGCHLPAPGSCQLLSPGTSSDVDIPPSLTNKGKVVLPSSSVQPGRLQLKICACSYCSSHCTVTDKAGRDKWGAGTMSDSTICREISQWFERACDWMQVLDQSCLSTGLASSTEPSYKCGIWEVPLTCNRREMVKYPWKAAE